ncbi:DUF447 domain-containing protein [Thermococcus sp.]|uniref:DUF447 domain-containing protein n=1 Tax=Thermococcus sp. TaxID=35749 RepID=UPI002624C7F4|nr:DUF447 domain-containing protein [Thermococcus sp.]
MLLDFFNEGQVYEVLLVTESNAAPIGVVRRGGRLFFKLFGGRSAEDIRSNPVVSVQVTNDVELIVRLALNLDVELEFEESPHRRIRHLPGLYGRVEFREERHEDELGPTTVLRCSLIPEGELPGYLPPRPVSRADNHLLEMAVNVTRLPVAVRGGKRKVAERLYRRILEDYETYRRLGGRSKTAEEILKLAGNIFG